MLDNRIILICPLSVFLKCRLWFIVYFLVLVIPFNSITAQLIYDLQVSDAANDNRISNVEVTWINESRAITSNKRGKAIMTLGAVNGGYRFYEDKMIWNGDQQFSLDFISLSGNAIMRDLDVGQSGLYTLPTLPPGIYVMELRSTTGGAATYKVHADGTSAKVVDTLAPYHESLTPTAIKDTFLLSKEGYYNREVIVNRGGTIKVAVSLLRKKYDYLDYFKELINHNAFELVSSAPARSNSAQVKAVKVIYDYKKDELYYANSSKYKLHYDFVSKVLGYDQGHFVFNQTQYIQNNRRYMLLANLNYYEAQDKYVIQLAAANQMTCEQVSMLYEKIDITSFFKDKLYFYPIKDQWKNCDMVKDISSEDLFKGQKYQALNLAESYGYLRKVSAADLDDIYLSRRDILLLDDIPNDVSVVSGIITSVFQTPLSHINVLSNSRGTPNMALRDAWKNDKLEALEGKLVHLVVGEEDFTIKEADLNVAEAFWLQREPKKVVYLNKNVSLKGLVDLKNADFNDVNSIGGKAANFAEVMRALRGDDAVPESAFAIPFYYYFMHMVKLGLDDYIIDMLQNEKFKNDPVHRKSTLKILRAKIMAGTLDPELLLQVRERIEDFAQFSSFRFRSSTNAEDIEAFSGAGLYDSHSAKRGHKKKTIEAVIKKVWASLWNWRAFEERNYYKIDHLSCAMGILVNRSFPDEDANGVLLTKNLYNENPGYIINVQHKEYSIVFPEPGVIHDQIMLFTWSIDLNNPFSIEYLTFSNIPGFEGEKVMTDQEIVKLGKYATKIKKAFYRRSEHNCNCPYEDFGVDIEFKVDSQVNPRKVYIKQARLYR